MEQIAVVHSLLKNGMAEIAVERGTACGAAHNCSECAGCQQTIIRKENIVVAFNDVEAGKGDIVKIRSENKPFLKTAAIVYILPLILALVFYGIAASQGIGGEGVQVLFAFLGVFVGILIAVAWDRHMKKSNGLRFHIVEIKKACSGM